MDSDSSATRRLVSVSTDEVRAELGKGGAEMYIAGSVVSLAASLSEYPTIEVGGRGEAMKKEERRRLECAIVLNNNK